MWALYMNPVTANAERYIPVVTASTKERLEQVLEDEKCERRTVGQYHLSYRDGPLQHFNPPQMNGRNCFGSNEGIIEVVSEDALRQEHERELTQWRYHFMDSVHL